MLLHSRPPTHLGPCSRGAELAAKTWAARRLARATAPHAAVPSCSSSGQPAPRGCAHRQRLPMRAHATLGAAAAGAQEANGGAHFTVSVILLAGGVGKRMGASIPKQYLPLQGRPIATHSLAMFAGMPEVAEIVIVCDPLWRDVFEDAIRLMQPTRSGLVIKWALPGAERQDSVFNGLQEATSEMVAVHDSARPLVTPADASRCFLEGWQHGAAVLGVMAKATIKEVDKAGFVTKTLLRSKLWEVQTPQVIRTSLLHEGFALVKKLGMEVTDDVSIVEAMGRPVKVTPGSYTNIKVTTPDDMHVAEKFLQEQQALRAAQQQAAIAAAAVEPPTVNVQQQHQPQQQQQKQQKQPQPSPVVVQ